MDSNTTTIQAGRKPRARSTLAPGLPRQYRAHDLAELLGVSVNTVWRWNAQGRMPKSRSLSPGVTVWSADEIEAWLNAPKAT